MAQDEKTRQVAGPKLARSTTASVRLDSDLDYLARIAARIQRRTLSSYIEWAVERSLEQIELTTEWNEDESMDASSELDSKGKEVRTLAALKPQLCSGDDVEKFLTLATTFPNVLDEEQKRLYNIIHNDKSLRVKSKPVFFQGKLYDSYGLDRDAVRARWAELNELASGVVSKPKGKVK
jgi:hypothetical protein